MKSLADLKRTMTVGTVVQVENHVYPELSGNRKVLVAQSARWCLSYPAGHPRAGEVEGSWLNVPKAKQCRFNGNSVTIDRDPEWDDAGPWCTITIPEG